MDFETFDSLIKNRGRDDGVVARFHDKAVKTSDVDKNGIPVVVKKTYVEIRIRDNNTEVFDQPATEDHKRRFAAEYERYKLEEKQIEGTPLNKFAFLDVDEIETLKYHGIFTLEVLSQIGDERAKSFGLEELKEKAISFIEVNKGNKDIVDAEKLKQEIDTIKTQSSQKDSEISILKQEIEIFKGKDAEKEAEATAHKQEIELLKSQSSQKDSEIVALKQEIEVLKTKAEKK